MFHGKIKSSEKLPRGTYFYIIVGDRFYAGEAVDVVEDVVKEPIPPYEPWWSTSQRWSKGMAEYWRRRGVKVPKYRIAEEPKLREPKKAITGSKPKLTDEFASAKQFRRLKQAELACERLKAMYVDLGVRVAIELHKGEK